MKFKLFKAFAMTLCIGSAFFNGTIEAKNTLIHAQNNQIKTVIFDLGNVLLKTSRLKKMSMVLGMQPSLIFQLAKKGMKDELYAMLHSVPAHSNNRDNIMHSDGKPMPQIMVDWQSGRPSDDIFKTIDTHLEAGDYSSGQKKLFATTCQFIFEPEQLAQLFKPIKQMTKLARDLKAQGYKLYVLSNWDKESFPLLQQKHPELFDLFDGVMISGDLGIGKPNPHFYNHLLQKYNLTPSECIFIDDEQLNVTVACNLGICGIVYDSNQSLRKQLIKLGVMQ